VRGLLHIAKRGKLKTIKIVCRVSNQFGHKVATFRHESGAG